MLKEIMKNTIEYVNSFPKKERKSYGQFFTPIQTAEYMASLIRTESEKVKILDPGAGNGLLTAAVVEHLIARGTAREISVVLYENDKNIQSLLKKNIEIISSYCSQKQVKLFIKTQKENFIVDNQKYWEMQKSKGLFDIVISNPPYLKIRKGERRIESDGKETAFGKRLCIKPRRLFLHGSERSTYAGVEGDGLNRLRWLEVAGMTLHVRHLLREALQVDDEGLGFGEGLSVLHALDVAFERVSVRGANGDDPVGARHLELQDEI